MTQAKIDFSCLPEDHRKIKNLPLGIEVSSFIHPATLFIEVKDNHLFARIGIKGRSGDGGKKLFAPSNHHNWVLEGDLIRPLPFDVTNNLNELLSGKENITYSEMLALQRSDIFEVDIDDEILMHANKQAELCSIEGGIPNLYADLYPYQENGVSWMRKTLKTMQGCILADEMGLGKTLQLIALMLLDPPSKDRPALVICPTSLLANWAREIEKFAPSMTYMIHRGPNRSGIYSGLMVAQVVISTYDTVVRDLRIFRSVDWMYVVCDEAQAIKNPESERRQAIFSLPRKYSIPVTGTPVENSLLDLWSLADFAVVGILGDQTSFENDYPDNEESADELAELTNPFILKRQVTTVAEQLPERVDIDMPIELSEDLSERYNQIREDVKRLYPSAAGLVAVGQLSLFCAHPWLQSKEFESENWEDESYISESQSTPLITPKIEVTLNLLREAILQNKKVLIFAVFNHCYELIKRSARDLNFKEVYWNSINGSTPAFERQRIVDDFSDYEGPGILVLNPKAAGAGLNITAATIVIHYTLNWNPALEMQASARAHRLGQNNTVTVYRLFYEDTVERVMVERVAWKRNLAGRALLSSNRDNDDLTKALSSNPKKTKS